MAETYNVRYKNVSEVDSEYRIFSAILVHLWSLNGEAEMAELANAANVGMSTLYSWKAGDTISPQIRTLTNVARAIGYEIVLKRTRSAPLRRVK